MKKIITLPALLFGLLLSNMASADFVEINDGFHDLYDPNNEYQVNAVVGPDFFTFRV